MKVMVEVRVLYHEDEKEDAIELCGEFWQYEQTFDDHFPEHEIEFGVTEWPAQLGNPEWSKA